MVAPPNIYVGFKQAPQVAQYIYRKPITGINLANYGAPPCIFGLALDLFRDMHGIQVGIIDINGI